MRRISSNWTFFHKRIFPIFWFGFLLVFAVMPFIPGVHSNGSLLPFPVIPVGMMAFGYVLMKKLIFDLVDEVLDEGDSLLVRNGTQQEHVALSDIMNVNYSLLVRPPRVTLSLRRASSFGDKVTFCAPVRFVPFATSPVIDELIQRVDAARRKR